MLGAARTALQGTQACYKQLLNTSVFKHEDPPCRPMVAAVRYQINAHGCAGNEYTGLAVPPIASDSRVFEGAANTGPGTWQRAARCGQRPE